MTGNDLTGENWKPMSKLFTRWKRSSQTAETLAELNALLRQSEAERAALLMVINEAIKARRDAEKLLSDSMFAFMLKVQEIRREARLAIEEARIH